MEPSVFFIVNGLIALSFVLYFMSMKKKKSSFHEIWEAPKDSQEREGASSQKGRESTLEKELTCQFMYNGENWDAFEILGVPAGSNLQMVEPAYRALKSKTHPDSFGIIEAAYGALKKLYYI